MHQTQALPLSNSDRLRPYACLCAYFLFAHGLLLLSRTVAWDGWCWYGLIRAHDFQTIWQINAQASLPQAGVIYKLLGYCSDPVFASKLLTWCSFLLCTLIFFWLLELHEVADRQARIFCAMAFSLQSNYLVLISLGILNYEVPYALFAIAAFCDSFATARVENLERKIALHIVSAVLFFASFTFAALLTFFAVYLLSTRFLQPGLSSTEWLKRKSYLLPLPVIFWLARPAPYGAYAHWNEIHFSKVLVLGFPAAFLWSTLPSFLRPFKALTQQPLLLAVALAGALLSWVFMTFGAKRRMENENRNASNLVFWGTFSFVAGVFPFLAVGKVPSVADMSSRFAVLIPAGQSLWLTAAFVYLRAYWREGPVRLLAAMLLGLLAMGAIDNQRRWDIDWFKQEAVLIQLPAQGAVRSANTIYVQDELGRFNNLGRYYRPYEFNWWFAEAFGDHTRLGLETESRTRPVMVNEAEARTWGMENYEPQGRAAVLQIKPGTLDLNSVRVYLKLKLLQITHNPDRYREMLSKAVHLESRASAPKELQPLPH